MNCSVCGNSLDSNRVVFRCSCGAHTHSHCWEKHVLLSHKPGFTIGFVDCEGRFEGKEKSVVATVPVTKRTDWRCREARNRKPAGLV